MDEVVAKAYAKINLSLDVLGRRPNGYHDVRMVMQSLELHDTLYLKKTQVGILLAPHDPKRQDRLFPDIRWDDSNLIYQAARLFLTHFHITDGVLIVVDKQIPSAAGLAGGSSDAAATLRGLNELFGVGATTKELQELGVQLGADVPYCLLLGTALSEGIGEVLTPLPAAPLFHCVLVKPEQSVSTKYVYEHLQLSEQTLHPNTDALLAALTDKDATALCKQLSNILEPVATTLCPVIPEIEQTLMQLGAVGACMSGSGPTVFGLFTEQEKAIAAADFFETHGYAERSFATHFYLP